MMRDVSGVSPNTIGNPRSYILRWGWALPRQSGMRSSAIDQPFLFQGAEATLGGAEAACVEGGAAGAAPCFAVAAGAPPLSSGR